MSNHDTVPLQKSVLIRLWKYIYVLFLNALQTKGDAMELEQTTQWGFNEFAMDFEWSKKWIFNAISMEFEWTMEWLHNGIFLTTVLSETRLKFTYLTLILSIQFVNI